MKILLFLFGMIVGAFLWALLRALVGIRTPEDCRVGSCPGARVQVAVIARMGDDVSNA